MDSLTNLTNPVDAAACGSVDGVLYSDCQLPALGEASAFSVRARGAAALREQRRQARGGSVEFSGVAFPVDLIVPAEAMWILARHEVVKPTSNDAERALRPAVIWRKTSLGAQSERGGRVVERPLSCVATPRKNERNVLEYLSDVGHAVHLGAPVPSFVA